MAVLETPRYHKGGTIAQWREGQSNSKYLVTLLLREESKISVLTFAAFLMHNIHSIRNAGEQGRQTSPFFSNPLESGKKSAENIYMAPVKVRPYAQSYRWNSWLEGFIFYLNSTQAHVNHSYSSALPILTLGLSFLTIPGLAETKINMFGCNFFFLSKRGKLDYSK